MNVGYNILQPHAVAFAVFTNDIVMAGMTCIPGTDRASTYCVEGAVSKDGGICGPYRVQVNVEICDSVRPPSRGVVVGV